MKKKLFYLLMLVCSISVFTSCSKDDDNTGLPIKEELAGTYKGNLSVNVLGSIVKTPQNVIISEAGMDAVTLKINNLSILGINIDEIIVNNCSVTKNGDVYSFTGEQVLDLSKLNLGDCKVKVVKGEISNGKLDLTLSVDTKVPVDLTVGVDFEGTKLSGDESAEAKILTFAFTDNSPVRGVTINQETGKILLTINDDATDEDLKNLTPTITISEKATITPGIGVAQDFSKSVEYVLVAENGSIKVYTVIVSGTNFGFEEWTTDDLYGYQTPLGQFGSTNGGSGLVYSMAGSLAGLGVSVEIPSYSVVPTSNAKVGEKAASLTTISLTGLKKGFTDYATTLPEEDASGILAIRDMCPNITAGSLFLGEFILDFGDPLASTKFGIPYNKKPLKFTGWYQYKPGDVYYDADYSVLDIKDRCAIFAVLYEEKLDDDNNNIPLTGADGDDNINTSSRIIMRAALNYDGAKSAWTHFDLPFELVNGKVYNADKKYYLAFVCTSSFDGDKYKGAPGSILTVDELSIVGE